MKVRALATDPRGRTLVAGFCRNNFALVQLLPDGRPDPDFGSRGWTLANARGLPVVSGGGATLAVALSRDGPHVYLAGITTAPRGYDLVLLRFTADGRPDPSFGRGGRRTATIPKAAEPKTIVPTRHGILVVLNGGPRPLVTFARKGEVRQQRVGPGDVTNVRAAVSRGRLVLGWNTRLHGSWRHVYHLGERSLNGL